MKERLSYVLLTPYTVAKSRTGGVLARLFLRLDLELVGAQMIAPDEEFVETYARLLTSQQDSSNPLAAGLLAQYVRSRLGPSGGRRHRTLLLLFRGEDPCRKLSDVCGALYPGNRSFESITGETIRDTYADLVVDPDDPQRVTYFEPAVLTPRSQDIADTNLQLFARWLPSQKNLVENMSYPDPQRVERTLVIIKPDSWKHASAKPGSVIDMFSRTGQRIIGTKIHHMSVSEAIDFYQPLRTTLLNRYAELIGSQARNFLEQEFTVRLSEETAERINQSFGALYAEDQFQQVIEFMTGIRADRCPPQQLHEPGQVKCMSLVYEGEQAQKKIRDVLGPTDPNLAPGGTVRREFGSNIMVNTAHASNSLENAVREMGIIQIEKNACADIIARELGLK